MRRRGRFSTGTSTRVESDSGGVAVPEDTREVADHPYGRPAEAPADVEEERRTEDVAPRPGALGIAEAERRFGGIDVPASLVGMLAALALLTLLAGIVGAAVGAIGYQTGVHGNQEALSLGSVIGGIVALFIAYFVGGWAAGRISRYDGVRNGLMTGVWTLVLAAILAGLGALLGTKYNVFANVNLPNWFSHQTLTVGAIVSGVVAVVVMLLGGALGGMRAQRYHRAADATIVRAGSGYAP
jgi:MFS family permease